MEKLRGMTYDIRREFTIEVDRAVAEERSRVMQERREENATQVEEERKSMQKPKVNISNQNRLMWLLMQIRKPQLEQMMANTPNDRDLPILEHLIELRDRLIKVALAVLVCVAISFVYVDPIWNFLVAPLNDALEATGRGSLATHDVFEGIITQLKVSVLAGIILASPVLFYQIWKFIFPALTHQEGSIGSSCYICEHYFCRRDNLWLRHHLSYLFPFALGLLRIMLKPFYRSIRIWELLPNCCLLLESVFNYR